MARMRVDVSRYLASWGKAPKGYGQWAFDIGGVTKFFTGTLTSATKEAKKAARTAKVSVIKVLA